MQQLWSENDGNAERIEKKREITYSMLSNVIYLSCERSLSYNISRNEKPSVKSLLYYFEKFLSIISPKLISTKSEDAIFGIINVRRK